MAEPFEYCEECNHPLSECGSPSPDGTPSLDCTVCNLRELVGRLRDEINRLEDKVERMEQREDY